MNNSFNCRNDNSGNIKYGPAGSYLRPVEFVGDSLCYLFGL